MARILWLAAALLTGAGCINHDTQTVPFNPFAADKPATPPPQKVNFSAAPAEVSMRVDCVGRKLLSANPQLGLKPLFAVIGDPKPEIFHHGTTFIYITSGLVGMCKTEDQLAALLGHELGKMVSEREARTAAAVRTAAGLPPPDVPVGQGGGYSFDMTHQAEMARYEKKYPRRPNLPPPDPRYLAQNYLEKAGYARAEIDAVAPLIDAAERNYVWEPQVTGGKKTDWTQ